MGLNKSLERVKSEASVAIGSLDAGRVRSVELERLAVELRSDAATARGTVRRKEAELEEERQRGSELQTRVAQLDKQAAVRGQSLMDLVVRICVGCAGSTVAGERRFAKAEARADLLQEDVRKLAAEARRREEVLESARQESAARTTDAATSAASLAAARWQAEEARQREQQIGKMYERLLESETRRADHLEAELLHLRRTLQQHART